MASLRRLLFGPSRAEREDALAMRLLDANVKLAVAILNLGACAAERKKEAAEEYVHELPSQRGPA